MLALIPLFFFFFFFLRVANEGTSGQVGAEAWRQLEAESTALHNTQGPVVRTLNSLPLRKGSRQQRGKRGARSLQLLARAPRGMDQRR